VFVAPAVPGLLLVVLFQTTVLDFCRLSAEALPPFYRFDGEIPVDFAAGAERLAL